MDKLPALAGLAQAAQKLTGDEYCAGLWRSSLPIGLLWRRKSPVFMEALSNFRALTWSWAALDGPIEKWRKGGWLSDGELIYEHHVEISISDVYVPFGSVETGHVDMKGPISVLIPMFHDESFDCSDGISTEMIEEGFPADFLVTPDFPRENLWTCVFDREIDLGQRVCGCCGSWLRYVSLPTKKEIVIFRYLGMKA